MTDNTRKAYRKSLAFLSAPAVDCWLVWGNQVEGPFKCVGHAVEVESQSCSAPSMHGYVALGKTACQHELDEIGSLEPDCCETWWLVLTEAPSPDGTRWFPDADVWFNFDPVPQRASEVDRGSRENGCCFHSNSKELGPAVVSKPG